jgi:hypothetical protein
LKDWKLAAQTQTLNLTLLDVAPRAKHGKGMAHQWSDVRRYFATILPCFVLAAASRNIRLSVCTATTQSMQGYWGWSSGFVPLGKSSLKKIIVDQNINAY